MNGLAQGWRERNHPSRIFPVSLSSQPIKLAGQEIPFTSVVQERMEGPGTLPLTLHPCWIERTQQPPIAGLQGEI